MASHSSDEMFEEEVQGEAAEGGGQTHSVSGKKRTSTQRSSSDIPPKPAKKPAQRSPAWTVFSRSEDDPSKALCHYCGTEIGCDSKTAGTGAMMNHIARCKMLKASKESGSQQVLAPDSNGVVTTIKYDKELFRRSVNEMIVLNELPFSFVESVGFRRFCHNVLPMYHPVCRRTATEDILLMFKNEKESLKKLFGRDKKAVSLTTDIWVAPTTSCSYMVVTAHWIDRNWQLQKRIISFKPVIDHKGETIASQLIDCLDEWGIERVFTVTVDNAKGNDKALRLFKDALMLKRGANAVVKDGKYLHMRCCAHILNLVVKDGLKKVNKSIVAIRNAVKYVRSSTPRLQSFELRVDTGKVTRGSLSLDCVTHWNSTYLMLTAAIKQRVAFEKMLQEDKLYNEYFLETDEDEDERVGPPTSFDWDEVQRLMKFLKLFFNCTLAFSASKTVTSSLCYNELFTIERNLILLSHNADSGVQAEAICMRQKFEKYWDGMLNMNPLVIIASVFDPRHKMQFASVCFDRLYGKDSVESKHLKTSIRDLLHQLYEEYAVVLDTRSRNESGSTKSGHGESEPEDPSSLFDLSGDEEYERMDSIFSEMVNEAEHEESSSELDLYLMEKLVPSDKNNLGLGYDVLSWWKHNSFKYPILSELAKDVLAVQISSVASESAFSTSGRVLDPYRSCLSPYMLEALICLQQWLRNAIQAEAQLPTIMQMMNELDYHESLGDPVASEK